MRLITRERCSGCGTRYRRWWWQISRQARTFCSAACSRAYYQGSQAGEVHGFKLGWRKRDEFRHVPLGEAGTVEVAWETWQARARQDQAARAATARAVPIAAQTRIDPLAMSEPAAIAYRAGVRRTRQADKVRTMIADPRYSPDVIWQEVRDLYRYGYEVRNAEHDAAAQGGRPA